MPSRKPRRLNIIPLVSDERRLQLFNRNKESVNLLNLTDGDRDVRVEVKGKGSHRQERGIQGSVSTPYMGVEKEYGERGTQRLAIIQRRGGRGGAHHRSWSNPWRQHRYPLRTTGRRKTCRRVLTKRVKMRFKLIETHERRDGLSSQRPTSKKRSRLVSFERGEGQDENSFTANVEISSNENQLTSLTSAGSPKPTTEAKMSGQQKDTSFQNGILCLQSPSTLYHAA
eukprot:GHVN01054170.1.p1 GENE.GHVN01054170.1~~GHVN01054170.1.p1  ORF type:complete len:240 (+),score=44.59 GHVN01054170.1:40-720(+)